MNKDRKVLAAVSGGPDSMALLAMLQECGADLCVAHVNYQKRSSAARDEEIVRNWCRQYGADLHVLHPHYPGKGNFQAWAREVRYAYFEQIAAEQGIRDIYVAHQKDDHLETYLISKKRKAIPQHYGLQPVSDRHGFLIHRPLLHMEKWQLEAWCRMKNIAFGIDESNLENGYLRNRLRHEVIEKMNGARKEELCREIEQENRKLQLQQKNNEKFCREVLPASLLAEKNSSGLDAFLFFHTGKHYSGRQCREWCRQLQKNVLIDLGDWFLERWNDGIYCVKKKKVRTYLFENSGQMLAYTAREGEPAIVFDTKGSLIETFWVRPEEFPLLLRPVRAGDRIHLREGTKKLSRFFIDRKIPRSLRREWMVVENREHRIVFVPALGCSVENFHTDFPISMLQCFPIKMEREQKNAESGYSENTADGRRD